jgi:protocadherin alpha
MIVLYRDCVQCRAFDTGEKKDTCERDCSYFNLIRVKDRDKLPQPADQSYPLSHCKERDANDCWFYYTYAIRNHTEREVYVVDTLGEWTDVAAQLSERNTNI